MGVDAQMFLKVKEAVSEDEVRQKSYALCCVIGKSKFFLMKPWEELWQGEKHRHALEIVTEYNQDGETIYPEKDETFIEVHLTGRYYGKGYERGPILQFIEIAEYLEFAFSFHCNVFYGGDSSGICAESFGPEDRRILKAYFFRCANEPYTSAFDREKANGQNPCCNYCGGAEMSRHGWGGGYALFVCAGCGLELEFRDGKWAAYHSYYDGTRKEIKMKAEKMSLLLPDVKALDAERKRTADGLNKFLEGIKK